MFSYFVSVLYLHFVFFVVCSFFTVVFIVVISYNVVLLGLFWPNVNYLLLFIFFCLLL